MKTVACFGSGEGKPGDVQYDRMQEIGRLLAKRGVRVITGGYGGSGMEAPIRGAYEAGGWTRGYVLACRDKKPNPFVDSLTVCRDAVPMDSPLPHRDAMEYCVRLGFLLQADGFVVDPTDPTPGTLVECLSVVNLNEKFWQDKPRPIVLASPTMEGVPFLNAVLAYNRRQPIGITSNPADAVRWLLEKLS